MKIFYLLFQWVLLLPPLIVPTQAIAQDREQILKHGAEIRKAFEAGDTERIKQLHHPEVIKALGYNDLKTNREEVIAGVVGVLENYTLSFVENEVENIFIQDGVAIEQTRFAIQGTPKTEGNPFVFKGRTVVTYIKYEGSPTGWATIREIIQPFSE